MIINGKEVEGNYISEAMLEGQNEIVLMMS